MFNPKFTSSGGRFSSSYSSSSASDGKFPSSFDSFQILKGEDGFSPIVDVEQTEKGHKITITDKEDVQTFEVLNGADGQNGQDGKDGYIPVKGTDYFTEADKDELVEDVIASIEIPNTEPPSWDEITDKPDIPSIDGLATEEYVDNAIANIAPSDGNVSTTNRITHGDDKLLLSSILDQYILDIDYSELVFDTTEIVIIGSSTTAVLGQAILGQLVLA